MPKSSWCENQKARLLILIFVTFAIFLTINFLFPLPQQQLSNYNRIPNIQTSNKGKVWLNFCNLTELNPRDPAILKYFKPRKDPRLSCKREIPEISKLIDGHLFIFDSNVMNSVKLKCQMRCLGLKDDWNLKFENWVEVENGTKVECDVVEVECKRNEAVFYNFLHLHAYRQSNSSELPKLPISEQFDVHVIVFDSVSASQFLRSLPKTTNLLQSDYEIINFKHLNKIGSNSHQNGFAILLGKSYMTIPKTPFSIGHETDYPGKGYDEICKMPIDNEQFIGFRYKDDGYATMLGEDWVGSTFAYPDCRGFDKPPADHYMRPFQIRIEKTEYLKKMNPIMYKKSCHQPHHFLFEYLKSFLQAYPDKPKFSISWMIQLAHNDVNELSSADEYFYQFFNSTKENFENAYVFGIGDHGLRHGKVRETEVGEKEDNNPMLFISLPKKLRKDNALVDQLKKNANELITHYDVYATLTGLVEPSNPRNPNPFLRGSSLFHALPMPRTCDALRIPFEYCNCRTKTKILSTPNKIGIPAAKIMVDQINFEIFNSSYTFDICEKLFLNETAKIIVEHYGGEENNSQIYKITFSTFPGNGKFWGFISLNFENKTHEIISSKFPRLDTYGNQAKCASKSPLQSYCYCIDQSITIPKDISP